MPREFDSKWSLLPPLMAGLAVLAFTAACSSGTHRAATIASPTPVTARNAAATSATTASATATPPVAASPTAPAPPAASAPPAQTPPASAAPASVAPAAPAPAEPTATPILITVPTPPPPDSGPCKPGQIKGDKATKTYYLPGMIGYNDLTANVDCFNTPDAATSAGYHLPGQ